MFRLQAAVGILTYAQQNLDVQLKESWYGLTGLEFFAICDLFTMVARFYVFSCRYEKLQRWDDALKAYTSKAAQATNAQALQEATLGVDLVNHVFFSLVYLLSFFICFIVFFSVLEENYATCCIFYCYRFMK